MPKRASKRPERKKIVNIIGKATVMSPSLAATIVPTNRALITVIGAVGPLICVGVPPRKAAIMPIINAPYIPAAAPNPDCTPKASANGRATMPAVRPPNKSPLMFVKSNFNSFFKSNVFCVFPVFGFYASAYA
jgi:hypothetical protein